MWTSGTKLRHGKSRNVGWWLARHEIAVLPGLPSVRSLNVLASCGEERWKVQVLRRGRAASCAAWESRWTFADFVSGARASLRNCGRRRLWNYGIREPGDDDKQTHALVILPLPAAHLALYQFENSIGVSNTRGLELLDHAHEDLAPSPP